MKLYIIMLSIGLGAICSREAAAHDNHKHEAPRKEISEEGARARATEEVARLVSADKLESSWKEASIKSIEKKKSEWLVIFENSKAKEKLLYVFLKASGEFVAANFTGK